MCFRVGVLFALVLASSLVSFYTPVTGADSSPNVTGYVYDSDSNKPLPGALVTAVNQWGYRAAVATTDTEGYYALEVARDGWYTVFVLKDLSETAGIDYVPGEWSVYVQGGGTYSYVFNLKPGASVLVKGEIRFVESAQPASDTEFTVISPDEPIESPLIGSYGGERLAVIGLNATHVVVPANTRVWLEVTASVKPQTVLRSGVTPMLVPSWLQPSTTRKLSLGGEEEPLDLSQGRLLQLNVERDFVQLNLDRVESVIRVSFSQLTRMEDVGFLLTAEREDLLTAMDLMDQAMVAIKGQVYGEAYSDLRRSYILAAETWNRMSGLSVDAYNSAVTLTFFLALTAASLVSLAAEGRPLLRLSLRGSRELAFSLKPFYMAGLYGLLLALFYAAFPGCRLIALVQFGFAAVVSLVFTFILLRLPSRFDKTKVQDQSVTMVRALMLSFSSAYRYMRRRRLRTALSVVTVATFMFSFVTLTSFSAGRGLVSSAVPRAGVEVDSLMVRNDVTTLAGAFGPIEPSLVEWLGTKPGVWLAPKAESIPSLDPLDFLKRAGRFYPVSGVVGVKPSIEVNITRISEVVVEGSYLQDGESNGVLISVSLAKRMSVGVGYDLYVLGRTLRVAGLFDEKALQSLRDVDGSPLCPNLLKPAGETVVVMPCPPEEVIVTSYETALAMPGVAISRVDILAESRQRLLGLFEEVPLTYEYTVYLNVAGELRRQSVSPYFEEKGMAQTLFAMALIALILGNMMLGAVHERRNELAIFSSVGLNPTHITTIFLAEAVILGFIGGGLGYLGGICSYRLLGYSIGGLVVREKASAEWGLVGLTVSIIATILGTVIPALKASTIVTPSLLRKWRIEGQMDASKPWVVDLPVKVRARELELFVNFVQRALLKESAGSRRIMQLTDQPIAPQDVQAVRRIGFGFLDPAYGKVSKNELVISPAEEGYYKATLYSVTDMLNVALLRQTGNFVRSMMFEWNVTVFKVATAVDSLSQVYSLVDAYHPKVLYAVSSKRDLGRHLRPLREQWLSEGTRVPKIVEIPMDEHDMEGCLKKAEEAISDANVVCVTGGSNTIGVALTMSALKHGKIICYVDDPRSPEEQRLHPFHTLPVTTSTVEQKES